jgi:hypothetical protein
MKICFNKTEAASSKKTWIEQTHGSLRSERLIAAMRIIASSLGVGSD